HRRLWFIPMTFGQVALIGVLILRSSMEDPRENYAQSRAAVEALIPAPVPPEENAWELYKGVMAVRVMYLGSDENNPFYKTDDDTKNFLADDVQELWRANAQAVQLLHTIGEKERCNTG